MSVTRRNLVSGAAAITAATATGVSTAAAVASDGVDYASIPDGLLGGVLRDDAAKWAAAFCQIAKQQGHTIDEGWMIGWFANAIEVSHAVRMTELATKRAYRATMDDRVRPEHAARIA